MLKNKQADTQKKAGMAAYQIYQQQQQQQQYNPPVVVDASKRSNSNESSNVELPSYAESGSAPYYLQPLDVIKAGAEAGNAEAQFIYGRALFAGAYGCNKDKDEASKWLEKSRTNKNQSLGALCAKGLCYELARGGIALKDREMAKRSYEQAASQGYIPAMVELALILKEEMYIESTSTTGYRTVTHKQLNPEITKRVYSLLKTAVDAQYPLAYSNLATCYEDGIHVPKDEREALKLHRLAAEAGSARAKMKLGDYYRDGLGGLRQDKKEAKRLYIEASNQNYDIGDRLKSPCCTIN